MKQIIIEKGICPICGCKELEYDAIELEDEQVCFPWTCPKCGTRGSEWYNLSFAGHNYIDEKGSEITLTED